MLGKRRALVTLAVVTVALGACSRKPEPQPPAPQQPPVQTTNPTPPSAPPSAPPAPDNRAEVAALRASLQDMVFFDYDQAAVRGDARSVLDRKAAILRANPAVTLRIEGHADERGSVEYNLALSLRRANAVRDYLINFGLDASRFDVAPIGEERPLVSGASEDAFARNRRGEFHITRGGDNLVAPR